MKIGQMLEVVKRAQQSLGEQGERVRALAAAIQDKLPMEINSTARLQLRADHLRDSGARPSRTEQERVLGTNDLVDLNFFERGLGAARAVCRIILRDSADRQIGYATGFMVTPRLLLTNHHVFPKLDDARNALAQFDYTLDVGGIERRGPSFPFRPGDYYWSEEELDFALIAVAEAAATGEEKLSQYTPLRLISQTGKINEGEFISIIQHPSGLPKQVAMRENKLLKIDDKYLVYSSDTAPGSSGSPLFNDSWQVVGLHSAGVPRKNPNGDWLTRNGQVATANTDDGDIDWIGNRGARVSRIVESLAASPAHPLLQELLEKSTNEERTKPPELQRGIGVAGGGSTGGIDRVRVTPVPGGATIEIPIGTTATIEWIGGRAASAATPKPLAGGSDAAVVEAYRQPWHDTDYSSRKGYSENFLSTAVKMPSVNKVSMVAKMKNSAEYRIPYEHFSVVMHKARRLALFTASNVDASSAAKKPEAGKDYSRKALGELGEHDIEKWIAEDRIAADAQLPDKFFEKDRKSFDKGHIVRRDDAAWGKSYAEVKRANGDTYHVTNCSPQVAAYNQSAKGGLWGKLENYILEQAKSEKLVLFAGPILDDANDKEFVGVDEDGSELRVQIPSEFWKVVVAEGPDGGLQSFAFVLEQDLSTVDWEFAINDEWQEKMVRVSDLEARIGLIKFPSAVIKADQFGEDPGNELMKRSGVKPG